MTNYIIESHKYHKIEILEHSKSTLLCITNLQTNKQVYTFDITKDSFEQDEKLIRSKYEKLREMLPEFEEKEAKSLETTNHNNEYAISLFQAQTTNSYSEM
jgi:ribulose 1,5-bisphosphate carboxylase large subunit-like protein